MAADDTDSETAASDSADTVPVEAASSMADTNWDSIHIPVVVAVAGAIESADSDRNCFAANIPFVSVSDGAASSVAIYLYCIVLAVYNTRPVSRGLRYASLFLFLGSFSVLQCVFAVHFQAESTSLWLRGNPQRTYTKFRKTPQWFADCLSSRSCTFSLFSWSTSSRCPPFY